MNNEGQLFFDIKSGKMKIFNEGKWEDFTLDPSFIQGTWNRVKKLVNQHGFKRS